MPRNIQGGLHTGQLVIKSCDHGIADRIPDHVPYHSQAHKGANTVADFVPNRETDAGHGERPQAERSC